jgi:hypothetical protein
VALASLNFLPIHKNCLILASAHLICTFTFMYKKYQFYMFKKNPHPLCNKSLFLICLHPLLQQQPPQLHQLILIDIVCQKNSNLHFIRHRFCSPNVQSLIMLLWWTALLSKHDYKERPFIVDYIQILSAPHMPQTACWMSLCLSKLLIMSNCTKYYYAAGNIQLSSQPKPILAFVSIACAHL